MISLLPAIHGFGALTVSMTTQLLVLHLIEHRLVLVAGDGAVGAELDDDALGDAVLRLRQLQLLQLPVGPFDTSATVLMPRASSTGLAPSITDSPTAK